MFLTGMFSGECITIQYGSQYVSEYVSSMEGLQIREKVEIV